MPKKFVGENSKAVVARARKAAVKEVEVSKKQKETEDAYWKDDDKVNNKRQQKKEKSDIKKLESLEKKAVAKALLEKEMDGIIKQQVTKQPLAKITRAQIVSENEKRNSIVQSTVKSFEPKTHVEKPIEENVNRLQPDEIATTVDEAIAMLSNAEVSVDKHPEKRMKAAYTLFEEKYLKQLKEENPSLRLSQLKQLLHKEWVKSCENPINQVSL